MRSGRWRLSSLTQYSNRKVFWFLRPGKGLPSITSKLLLIQPPKFHRVITLGNFLLNFGHEKCPRLRSPLLWNSARPYRLPAKSENRSGFIAMWERTGTHKQCFDERGKSCEERAFYRYLACLVFEYFETSFMSAKKEFLARFLREKSGWSKLWKRFYICCLVPISQKRKRGKHEEGIYPLFWCFSCLSLELTQMNFCYKKYHF